MADENHTAVPEPNPLSWAWYRSLARKMKDSRFFDGAYAVADGSSNCYTTFKYLFDIGCLNSGAPPSACLHAWMLSPEGAAIALVTSAVLLGYSLAGNLFDDDDKNPFKRYLAASWNYVRDVLKALKNAFKGLRIVFIVSTFLSSVELRFALLPCALAFGALAAINRICYRNMIEKRKKLMTKNGNFLQALLYVSVNVEKAIPELPEGALYYEEKYRRTAWLDAQNVLYYIDAIGNKQQVNLQENFTAEQRRNLLSHMRNNTVNGICHVSMASFRKFSSTPIENEGSLAAVRDDLAAQNAWADKKRPWAYAGQAFGGLIDGSYLYMGMLTAVSFGAICPALLIPMIIGSIVMTLCCIVSRMYEEYDYQQRLLVLQKRVEMAVCIEEMELWIAQMKTETDPERKSVLHNKIVLRACTFSKNRIWILENTGPISGVTAAISGIHYGVVVYSAVSTMMFMIATGMALASLAFPPLVLFVTIVTGVATMLLCIGFMLSRYYKHQETVQECKTRLLTDRGETVDSCVNPVLVPDVQENSANASHVDDLVHLADYLCQEHGEEALHEVLAATSVQELAPIQEMEDGAIDDAMDERSDARSSQTVHEQRLSAVTTNIRNSIHAIESNDIYHALNETILENCGNGDKSQLFRVFRAGCSSLHKSENVCGNFFGIYIMDQDESGLHDNIATNICFAVSSIVFLLAFGGREFAKCFGRPAPDEQVSDIKPLTFDVLTQILNQVTAAEEPALPDADAPSGSENHRTEENNYGIVSVKLRT